jgi:rhodanese-related sulfurtransferase
MKIYLPGLLCLLLLSSIQSEAQSINQVNAEEFEKGIQGKDIQVLDVRTAGEYKTGHLQHALQADWNNETQFKDRTQHLDKSKPIYVYCLSGARSSAAAQWLQQNGYKNVVALKGGINAWKQARKPLEAAVNIPQMTIADYKALITTNGTILVDFGAEWCAPCKKMEPVLETLKKEMGNRFKLVKIDGGIHLDVEKTRHYFTGRIQSTIINGLC